MAYVGKTDFCEASCCLQNGLNLTEGGVFISLNSPNKVEQAHAAKSD